MITVIGMIQEEDTGGRSPTRYDGYVQPRAAFDRYIARKEGLGISW